MIISIIVKPNSKRAKIDKLPDGSYKVFVNAPPVDGKANKAAVEFIASSLGIPRSGVCLISGEKGRHKIFEIVGFQPSDVARKLAQSGV